MADDGRSTSGRKSLGAIQDVLYLPDMRCDVCIFFDRNWLAGDRQGTCQRPVTDWTCDREPLRLDADIHPACEAHQAA